MWSVGGEHPITLFRSHVELQRRGGPRCWCEWQVWFEWHWIPFLCFFPSVQSIDDLNKWALFLVSPFILEAEHIAFVTESIWVQGESLQRPSSSSETVSNMFFTCVPEGNYVLTKSKFVFPPVLSWPLWPPFFCGHFELLVLNFIIYIIYLLNLGLLLLLLLKLFSPGFFFYFFYCGC